MSKPERVYWYGIGLRPAVIEELARRPGWEPVGLSRDVDSIALHAPNTVDLWVVQAPDLTETLRWGRVVRERMGAAKVCVLVPREAPWDVWRAAVNAVIGPAPAVRTVTSIAELVDEGGNHAGSTRGSETVTPTPQAKGKDKHPSDSCLSEPHWNVVAAPGSGVACSLRPSTSADPGEQAAPSGAGSFGNGGKAGPDGFLMGNGHQVRWNPGSQVGGLRPGHPGAFVPPEQFQGQWGASLRVTDTGVGDGRGERLVPSGSDPERSATRPGSRQGWVWALQGPKGGVGTTWLSCELAAAAAATGLRVGLVDADWTGGDAATYLDLGGGPTILDLQPVMDGLATDWEQQWLVHPPTGLRLLAAPPRPELARLIEGETLARVLARGREHFDLLIVDGPAECLISSPWHGKDVPADRRLLITVPTPAALRRTRAWLENHAALSRESPPRVEVVVNRWSGVGSDRMEIERYLRHPVIGWLPDAGSTVDEVLAGGSLLVIHQPGHPLAVAVKQLASRLLGYNADIRPTPGLWRLLRDWFGSRRSAQPLRSAAGA